MTLGRRRRSRGTMLWTRRTRMRLVHFCYCFCFYFTVLKYLLRKVNKLSAISLLVSLLCDRRSYSYFFLLSDSCSFFQFFHQTEAHREYKRQLVAASIAGPLGLPFGKPLGQPLLRSRAADTLEVILEDDKRARERATKLIEARA
jgi:hypothetical protein